MCIFGTPASQKGGQRSPVSNILKPVVSKVTEEAPAATPAAEPIPSPTPTKTSAQSIQAQRRRRIQQVRRGILSTIKTSPLGIVGAGANLNPANGGKKVLGA